MVSILLAEGFEEAEALVPADLLRRAGAEVALTGVTGRTVAGGHGISVVCDITVDEINPDQLELVVLPGGLGGVEGILNSESALELVQEAAVRGKWVAAICAAPTILAQLGLLDGRAAVCYPGMEDQMSPAAVRPGQRVVQDGPFITGEAAGSAFDFGLKLVEVLRGAEAAAQVRDAVHYHG